jgi:hypothetical protein
MRTGLLACLLLVAATPARADHPDMPRAGFDLGLHRSVGWPVFAAILRNYPAEGSALIERLYEISYAHRREGEAAAMPFVAQALAAFMQSKAGDAANAPPPLLLRIVRLRLAFFERLAAIDVAACGRIAASGNNGAHTLPAAVQALSAGRNAAIVDAAGAGHRGPAIAGRGRLSPEDRAALRRVLQTMDPDGTLTALVVGGADADADAAPAERRCRAAIMINEAMLRLPTATAANVVAVLLATEMGAAPPAR